jgi:aminoglycoside phosphotransferase (APT) family kinase protein
MLLDVDAVVDRTALTCWLDANAPEIGDGVLKVGFLHGGTSNVILSIDRGGAPAVLRRAPPVPPPNSEQALAREARILRALNRTAVAHPHLFGYCSDDAVIGAPFYVMEKVDGWAPELRSDGCTYPPMFDTADARREIGLAIVDALADLALVDHQAIGLGDFGRPGDFLARQVDRWLGQLRGYPARYPAYRARDLPGLDEVANWLRHNLPTSRREGIVHGDYGPPNILFAHERPARVRAIVDWELATIGDPRLDLALLLCNLRDDAAPHVIPSAAYFDPTDFPTRQELIARYAERTALDLSGISYHLVLAQFRMACILEYKVADAAGNPMHGRMAIFPDMVRNLVRQAHAMIERL